KLVKGSTGATVVPRAFPRSRVTVDLPRLGPVRVPYKLPRSFAGGAELRRVTPEEALVVQLARAHKGAIFPPDDVLADKLGLPDHALRLFAFDDLAYVAVGEPASKSKDVVLVCEAL